MSNHRLLIDDLTVSYRGVPALHHISLDLQCGRCVGLLGPNGAGKSTLLKSIVGLTPVETGRVRFDAHDHGPTRAESSIAYLPQRSLVDWDFPLTVRGLAEMGRYPALGGWKSVSAREDHRARRLEALAATHLDQTSPTGKSARFPAASSNAPFLARAVAQGAHVYLLDEPFTGLDRNAQAAPERTCCGHSGREGRANSSSSAITIFARSI